MARMSREIHSRFRRHPGALQRRMRLHSDLTYVGNGWMRTDHGGLHNLPLVRCAALLQEWNSSLTTHFDWRLYEDGILHVKENPAVPRTLL